LVHFLFGVPSGLGPNRSEKKNEEVLLEEMYATDKKKILWRSGGLKRTGK